MKENLFYPAPEGLPVPVHPPRGDADIRRTIQESDWRKVCNLRDDSQVRAGALWLYGFLEDAHEIAQKDRSPEGSYWHALMHRSEGDYGNSMYWYGKVGKHAIFAGLRAEVEKILQEESESKSGETLRSLLADRQWNPRPFVNLCQQASEGRFRNLTLLQRVAAVEYNLLMAYILDLHKL